MLANFCIFPDNNTIVSLSIRMYSILLYLGFVVIKAKSGHLEVKIFQLN